MKKMLKSAGLVCPHLSRKFTYLLLLLVTLIGGSNSAWAEDSANDLAIIKTGTWTAPTSKINNQDYSRVNFGLDDDAGTEKYVHLYNNGANSNGVQTKYGVNTQRPIIIKIGATPTRVKITHNSDSSRYMAWCDGDNSEGHRGKGDVSSTSTTFVLTGSESGTLFYIGGAEDKTENESTTLYSGSDLYISKIEFTVAGTGGTLTPELFGHGNSNSLSWKSGTHYFIPTLGEPGNDDYYTFNGWYTDKNFTTPVVEGSPVNGNAILWAKWTKTTPIVAISETTSCYFDNDSKPSNITNFDWYGAIQSVGDAHTNATAANPSCARSLKFDSKGSIAFNLARSATVDLYFADAQANKGIKVDGVAQTIGEKGKLSLNLAAGTHTITRNSDEVHLFYINITIDNTSTIGNTDFSSDWNSNTTSEPIALQEGKTVTFSFTNHNGGSGYTYNNWNVITSTSNDKDVEFATQYRCDGVHYTGGWLQTNKSANWSELTQAKLDGAHVDVKVSKLGTVICYYAVMTLNDGTTIVTSDMAYNKYETAPSYAWLRVDNSYIDDLEVTTSDIVYRTVSSTKNDNDGGNVTINVKDTDTEVTQVVDGTTVKYTVTPADWYLFDGWYVGQNKVGETTTYETCVTSDLSVQAAFNRYYKVNVIANNAAYGDVTLTGGTNNEAIKKGTNISLTASPKTGYSFVKWTVDGADKNWNASVGSNKIENLIQGVTNDKKVVTITAIFESITTNHSITFNANGGKGTMDPQQVEDNVVTTINANSFSGVNAATNFVGWNTAEDGSGTDYAPGAEITLTDDIVLYAQWFRFSAGGSQTPIVVVDNTKEKYTFVFTSTKNLNITQDDFEVSSSNQSIATAVFRDLTGGVRVDVTGVSAGTADIKVRFKGRAETLYGEATAWTTFTVKPADINTELLTIEDDDDFYLNNDDKNFRGYEWVNIDNQSDRVSLEDGGNTNISFTYPATYITDDRYFYLHAGSGDRLEDSGFDGLKLNGNPSASSGHYLEMDVHGSGLLTLEVWNSNDRTIVVSSSNTFDDASIIATQEHTGNSEVQTYNIIVNNQGTRHLFLGSKGGAIRIGTFHWHPFAKPLLSISPTSGSIDVNNASATVPGLTTMTPTYEKDGSAIANPVYKYRSSNPEVATVDENTGAITPIAAGTTTITIQLQSDGETHGAQTAEFTLTVTGTMKKNVTMNFSGNLAFTTVDAIPAIPSLTIKDENGADLSVAVTYSIEAGTSGLSIDASTGALSGTPAAGTATVTATYDGDETYKSATATYTITITAGKVVAPVITITAAGGENSFSVLAEKPEKEIGSGSKIINYNDATEVYVLQNFLNENKNSTKNSVLVTIESPQAGITIKYKYDTKIPNEKSSFDKNYTEPIPVQINKVRYVSIDVAIGDEHWYGYYKFTDVPDPAITPDGENAAGCSSRNVTVTTSRSGSTMYYTLDGSDATTASTAYSSPINLTESKVVKAAAVYPGILFADGNDFSTVNVVKTVFIYDPTIFMADASAGSETKAKKLKGGDKVELNDGKLVVTFGNTGKYKTSNGYVESTFTPDEARNEAGTIPSYSDVYTDRQMFNGDNPRCEDGGYAGMNEEDGGTLFKTPIGGVMYRFEPTSNGVVTFWARQNGALEYRDNTYTISRRPVYIMDEDGVYLRRNTNEEFTDIKQINGVEAHISNLSTFGTDPSNAMKYFKQNKPGDANYKYFASMYGDNVKATDKIGDIIYSETPEQANGVPMYGWEVPEKNYVRYSFPVKAGKTYYLGGKGTKVGFSAVKFDELPTTSTNVTIDHKSTVGLPSMTVGQQYNVTLNRKFTGGKWNALLLPFSVSETQLAEVFGEGVEVMFFENMPNDHTFQVLRHFYQMVYANVPCLIRPKAEVSNPIFTNVTYAGGAIREQNIGNGYKVTGSYKKTVVKQNDYVTSWDDTYDLTFFQATGTSDASRAWNATRGWITSSEVGQSLSARKMTTRLALYDDEDNTATYIDTIFNGSVLDDSYAPTSGVREGVYNIYGLKIADTANNLPSGIYIVNGKKIVVKK